MSAPSAALAFFILGGAFIAIGAYAFRIYRATFSSDPRGSITRDLFSVLLLGSRSPPPILAALMFYLGGTCICFGVLAAWLWVRY